jgi:hypothetical protein
MRSLFGVRTAIEAAFLVAVPVVALEADLSWYAIVAAGAVAYVLVLALEWVLWRRAREAPEPEPARPVAAPPLAPAPEPEPPPPVPAPLPPPPAPDPEPLPPAAGPRRWNLRDLERLAREHAGGDPLVDEERTFLLTYLREFAGPDGLLPDDFDAVVRQSFGPLVART